MLELVELGTDELGRERYAYGSHFVAFLMDEYGQEAVAELLSDPRYPDELPRLFEERLGESFAALDQRWREETWDVYFHTPLPCDRLVPLGSGFEASATLDCDANDTLGVFGSYVVNAPFDTCFTTDERSPVTLLLTGDPGRISLIGYDCNPDDEEADGLTTGFTMNPGVTFDVTLARCTWLIDFVVDDYASPKSQGLTVTPI